MKTRKRNQAPRRKKTQNRKKKPLPGFSDENDITPDVIDNTMENELKNLRHIKCSPLTKKNKFTCLENNTLLELRELWNHHSPNKQITTTNPHEIWKKFKCLWPFWRVNFDPTLKEC